jgi:hypothetical protein
MNKINIRGLKYGITIAAIVIAFIHLIWPSLSIDAITITLLFIALVPWLSPLFKSLEFPGGWKIEFQEMKEQLGTMIAKQTEPVSEALGPTFSIKAYAVNDEATRLVLKALGNPNYTWRYLTGLATETKLSRKQILESIKWLLDNRLVTELREKQGTLWGLSREGWDLLRNILREETSKNDT